MELDITFSNKKKKKLDITNIKFHNFILTKKFAKISILIIVSFSFKKNCIELDFSNIEFYMAFFFPRKTTSTPTTMETYAWKISLLLYQQKLIFYFDRFSHQ